MTTPMLEIRNLHARIEDRDILKGVNLIVPKGEVHAIMGRNGSGKSTLSYVLAGQDGGAAPLYIVLNGADEDVELTFPEWPDVGRWVCVLDTANGETDGNAQPAGAAWKAKPRSVLAFAGLR